MVELDERLNLFWVELKTQALAFNTFEFEYSIEMWGVMWMPWFVEIDEKLLKFTANDIHTNDLEVLIKQGFIEFIKEYETGKKSSEIERIRYRIVQNPTA